MVQSIDSTPSCHAARKTPQPARSFVLAALGLHAALVVAAAGAWTFLFDVGGGYEVTFVEALLVLSIPGLLARPLSMAIAGWWVRRVSRKRARSAPLRGTPAFLHYAGADLLVTTILGCMAFPVVLLAYFVLFSVALTLFLPVAPLLTAALYAVHQGRSEDALASRAQLA